jgi:hypothetical protein
LQNLKIQKHSIKHEEKYGDIISEKELKKKYENVCYLDNLVD